MNALRMHWPAAVLAAAIILPAGLWAQATPQPLPAQSGNMGQVFAGVPSDEGWLGVAVTEVSAQQAKQAKLPKPGGAYVTQVESDSPASKAGIQAHDIIVVYNGQAVVGVLQFRRLVEETPPGRSVSIRVSRGGNERTLTAQLASRRTLLESRMQNLQERTRSLERQMPSPPQTSSAHPILGVRAMDVQGQLGQYFQVPGGRGVLVVGVTAGSAADKVGMKAGDVIYQVEGKAVQTVVQLEQSLRDNCSPNGVSLGIVRKGVSLVLRPEINCPQPSASSNSST